MAESREWTGEGELPEGVTEPPMVSREFRRLQNAYADEQACKEIAEERCQILQREVKELREQLDIFMTVARLGVLVVSDPTEGASSEPTAVMTDSTEAMSDTTTVMSDSIEAMSDSTVMSDSTEALSDSAVVMSDSVGVMSDTEAVISDSTVVMSDLAAVMSDPAAVMSEPAAVMSEPAAVMSEPAAVMSEPAAVMSEPAAVMSEPAAVMSEPAAVMSEPAAVKSEPAAVMSEPAAVESEPAAVESEPAAVESDSTAVTSEGTLTSEELIASLKLQLLRVLESNRLKSIEILKRLEEIRSVKEDLTMTRCLIERLNKLCDDLQGVVNTMTRHKEEVKNLRKEMHDLFHENECYKDANEKLREYKGKQEELVAKLIVHASEIYGQYEEEKRFVVDIRETMGEQLKQATDKHKEELDAAKAEVKAEVDKMKFLYSKLCVETSVKEAQLKAKTKALLENRLMVLLHMQEKQMARALEEQKDIPKEGAESELAEAYRRCGEMILDARLTTYEQQRQVTQQMLEEIRGDVEEMWQTVCDTPDPGMVAE